MADNRTTTLPGEIEDYATKLAALEESGANATVEQVLDTLLARDRVRNMLAQRPPAGGTALTKLRTLDERLRQQATIITTTVDLEAWHPIVQPGKEDWWWSLENPDQQRWTVRFGWLWNAIAVLWLVVTLFLIFDMAPRFPNVGPDTMNTVVQMTQLSIAILAAGGALTLAGRKLIDNFLLGLRIPAQYLREAKTVLAILVLGGLIWLRLSLPDFARFYNNRGVERHHAGEITYALHDYERALNLEPNFVEVHYNLGLLYEDMGDFGQAEVEYRYAIEGDLDLAYINLSRLYILEESYSQAASLLELRLLEAEETDVRYDMLKNLGWARVGQERYGEAVSHLQQAVALEPDKAPAHCLLAQAYEGLADAGGTNGDRARTEWEQCLALASVYRPDEDTWVGMAKQRLAAQ